MILPLNLPLLKHLLILFKKLVNWLKSCPEKFEPDFCRYFVEAAFCPLQLNDHLKYFQQFLNSCYINMSFSTEAERQNEFSSLDVEVIREKGKFTTIRFRKRTFSGVYSNFERFYLLFENLVWYTFQFIDVLVFPWIEQNSMQMIFRKNGYL